MKIVIGDPKTKKCYQKETESKELIGKKIGDTVKGDFLDLADYEFVITGGSDKCGFPMRKDINTPRAKILAVEGIGLKKTRAGMRKRKTVCGNTINESIVQVNVKVTKAGKESLALVETAETQTEEKK